MMIGIFPRAGSHKTKLTMKLIVHITIWILYRPSLSAAQPGEIRPQMDTKLRIEMMHLDSLTDTPILRAENHLVHSKRSYTLSYVRLGLSLEIQGNCLGMELSLKNMAFA